MIITISGDRPPGDQIHSQIRGLVTSGRLAADEKLPSVRQLANDLRVAPGTVAKAYRKLEAEGILATRPGSGTRVSRTADAMPLAVVQAARRLVDRARAEGVDIDDAVRVVKAVWER